MCGIAGFVGVPPSLSEPESVLRNMTRRLVHRGPDAEGFFSEGSVYLGHRRLQVIDLQGGQQPFETEDLVLVFNGEIYNYKELRKELSVQGETFQSESDTEVLARGWTRHGLSFLERLNGMFAFAVWDRRTRTLTLARDRMGQKPLYVYSGPHGVAFASELGALQAFPALLPVVSPQALRKYFLFDYVPTPNTILEGVTRLEPGSWHSWGPEGETSGTYWSLEGVGALDTGTSAHVESALEDAIRLRLRSDVPLGIFLSGGIDSSALVALAARQMNPGELHTFSIGFEEKTFDESSHASRVANHFGTVHHERILSTNEMLRVLPKALQQLDEPMADGSFLPTYLLSEFARETVTVALGGDGGDELFMGYPTFFAHGVAQWASLLPRSLWGRVIGPLVERLPVSQKNLSFDYQLKRFAMGMQANAFARHFVWIGAVPPWEQSRLFRHEVLEQCHDRVVVEDVDRLMSRFHEGESLHRLSLLYSALYLGDDILVKVDRASMAHGLEARAPFLDHRVVEAALRLPVHKKLSGRNTKVVLREILARELPTEILQRPKKGFGMPIGAWLNGPLEEWARDMLSPERLDAMEVFNPQAGWMYLQEHKTGKRDHRKVLWSLLVFASWWERTFAPTQHS